MLEYLNRPHDFLQNVGYHFLRIMLSITYVVQDLHLYRPSVSASDIFNISLPAHFEMTATVKKTASSSAYCYFQTENYDAGSLRQNGSITVRKTGNVLVVDKNTSIIQLNQPTTLKYEFNNGTHTISANGQSATGTDSTSIGNFKKLYLQNYTASELKIKAL